MIAEGLHILPFWAGVVMTIVVELGMFVVLAIIWSFRHPEEAENVPEKQP